MKNLTTHHFREIITKSYSLDHIFLLKLINDGYDVSELCKSSNKIDSLVQTLVRKELLTEDRQTVTITGKDLLTFMETKHPEKLKKAKDYSTEFDKWWNTYPATDGFTYRERTFAPTRTLRQAKEACRAKFEKIIEKGKYSVDDLVAGLTLDIQMRKEDSVRSGTNKLKYMQNSLTYLNQETYEASIELSKTVKVTEPKQKPTGGIDI